jgi:hypothetical protein
MANVQGNRTDKTHKNIKILVTDSTVWVPKLYEMWALFVIPNLLEKTRIISEERSFKIRSLDPC